MEEENELLDDEEFADGDIIEFLRGMMWWMRYAMSEKLLSNFWSQCPEVTLQLNIGTIVMGVFLKNHKSEQLPFFI